MARKVPQKLILNAAQLVRSGSTLKDAALSIGCVGSRRGYTHQARAVRHANMIAAAYSGTPNPAVSQIEHRLGNLLVENGIPIQRQVMVEGYLIDIVIDHIAVEVRAKHSSAFIMREDRAKKLIKAGYGFVFIQIRNMQELDWHCQDIITTLQTIRCDPPIGREYRVIRCRLDDLGSDYQIDEFTVIRGTPKTTRSVS